MFGGLSFLIYKIEIFKRFKKSIFCISITVFLFSLFAYSQNSSTNLRVVFFGIPALFIVATLANFRMPKKSLQTAGSYSYSLYLIHFPLLSFYFKIINMLNVRNFPGWLVIVISAMVCNAAAFVIWKFIEVPVTASLRLRFTSQSTP
jgi:peptidoglycan/LPS O-acetylase OafA/YrhL